LTATTLFEFNVILDGNDELFGTRESLGNFDATLLTSAFLSQTPKDDVVTNGRRFLLNFLFDDNDPLLLQRLSTDNNSR